MFQKSENVLIIDKRSFWLDWSHKTKFVEGAEWSAYKKCFEDWKRRWQVCVASIGAYFEVDKINILFNNFWHFFDIIYTRDRPKWSKGLSNIGVSLD